MSHQCATMQQRQLLPRCCAGEVLKAQRITIWEFVKCVHKKGNAPGRGRLRMSSVLTNSETQRPWLECSAPSAS